MHATDLGCSCEIKQQHFRVLLRTNSQARFTNHNQTVTVIGFFAVDLNRAARHLNPRITRLVHRVLNFLPGR